MLTKELKNLEGDAKAAYGYVKANWKRMAAWYAVYYAGSHWGPTGVAKVQSALKAFGL